MAKHQLVTAATHDGPTDTGLRYFIIRLCIDCKQYDVVTLAHDVEGLEVHSRTDITPKLSEHCRGAAAPVQTELTIT